MRAAAAAISAATTQAEVDAAAKLVAIESVRSSTAKQAAIKLVRLQEIRLEHASVVSKALQDKLDGQISSPAYTYLEERAAALSTLLSAGVSTQLQTVGKAVASPSLTVEAPFAALKSGTGSITPAAGWVGFPGGCALPAAQDTFRPQPLSPGPSIITTSKMVQDTKARMLADPLQAKEHAYLLRSAIAEGIIVRDPATPWIWFPTRVMRLGYGWLAGQDILARDKLATDTRDILLAGPGTMGSLRSATVLTAAATAADWIGGVPAVNDSVLVKWIGAMSCMLADHDNWVDGPTNLSAIHDSAMFLAAVAFLKDRPTQSAALAKATLTAVQPALRSITTDGGSFEGPGYWNYQSTAVSSLYSTMANVYGTAPVSLPSLANVSKYAIDAATPTGQAIDFADSFQQRMSPLMPAWDSYTRRDSAVAGWVINEYQKARDVRLLWWWTSPTTPRQPVSARFSTTGLAVLQAPGKTAALKGGTNGSLHSHLDLGTFSYHSKGVDWIIDPGAGSYSLPGYFSSTQRWTYWKTSTASHSTISDSGKNQPLTATAALAVPSPTGAVVDLRAALPGTTKALRSAALTTAGVNLTDSIQTPQPRDLRWQIVTDATVTITGTQATLNKSGQTLTITFTGAPPTAQLTAAPAPETSSTGAKLTLLTLTLPQITTTTLTATFK
ncbi:Heparinase II/III-like protein [Arthrobacter cupressi]|uniref:Heparinase II/III-like protein n=2 Tax=Arthrobacter cupressi TaxID=1045773 RepID=A0A1G8UHA3_9MICC|nr:Heparinase II/III-like protein [Arthrobacter cupressi]